MGYPLLVIGIAVALPFRNHVAMGRGNPVGDVVSQPTSSAQGHNRKAIFAVTTPRATYFSSMEPSKPSALKAADISSRSNSKRIIKTANSR
jgi:hypothetical protein